MTPRGRTWIGLILKRKQTGAPSRSTGMAFVLATAMAGMMALSALAQSDSRREVFRDLDTDGNGCISRAEFEANKVRVIFRKAKENEVKLRFEDTHLSRAAFDGIDIDKNGFITPSDVIHSPLFYFDQIDVNSNGCIDFQEFEGLFTKLETAPAK